MQTSQTNGLGESDHHWRARAVQVYLQRRGGLWRARAVQVYLVAVHVSAAENCAKTSQIVLVRPTTNDNNVLGELRMDTPRTERTDPALIGWQRLGGFTFRRKIDHTSLHIKTSISESRPPSGKRGRGAQTSSSNTEPVLETAHEDAERDDEHPVGNTAKLTRLLKASTDTLSLMA